MGPHHTVQHPQQPGKWRMAAAILPGRLTMHRGMVMAFGVALCRCLLEQRLAFQAEQYGAAHER